MYEQLSLFEIVVDKFGLVDGKTKTQIELIKENSNFICIQQSKSIWKLGEIIVRLYLNADGQYLNGMDYKTHDSPFWHFISHSDFIKRFINEPLQVLVKKRLCGQPKLAKPVALKGLKAAFSVDYIPKRARCQVFIEGENVWVKHVDWFSPSMEVVAEDAGAPLEYLIEKYVPESKKVKGFVYPDTWGDIVLRNEAWVCVKRLVYHLKYENVLELTQAICKQIEHIECLRTNSLDVSDMNRFIEAVINTLKTTLKAGE